MPSGVVYKTASESVNDAAKARILKLYSGHASKSEINQVFGGGTTIVGPYLWARLNTNSPDLKEKLTASDVHIITPITDAKGNTGKQEVSAGLLKTKEDAQHFWTALQKLQSGGKDTTSGVKVRKLALDELSLYWFMIPFDIHEPVFIVEVGDLHLLINLRAENDQAVWVDDFSDTALGSASLYTDPVDDMQYAADWKKYMPADTNKKRPRNGRVTLEWIQLLTSNNVIEANVTAEDITAYVDRLEDAIAKATSAYQGQYELALTVTFFPKAETHAGIAVNGKPSQAELQAISKECKPLPSLHTRADEIKIAVRFKIGEPDSSDPDTNQTTTTHTQ